MWQRFTERARRVVFFAQEEAGKLGENYVSPEHILLAIAREEDTVAAKVLNRMGVSIGALRAEVMRQVARGDGRLGQDMQLTPRSKRAIDLAYDEARQLNNNYIGTEHLLLGLIREGESLAARVLNRFPIDLEQARREVSQLQDAQRSETESSTVEEIIDAAKVRIEKARAEAQRIRDKRSALTTPIGALGTLQAAKGRMQAEVATDAAAFVQLAAIFATKDAHGYRAMADGDQTMFLLPQGTPLKALVPPAGSEATLTEGMYVRVLAGEYEGYAGWIFHSAFALTGPDDAPFPPT